LNIIDDEIGVYNREYFLRRLSEEMVRARRNRYSLSLALMRVDGLALLNGADSAKVRAEILRQVATLSSQYLREEDIVAHYEGDVLGLLLPDMTAEDAKALMEHLHTRVVMTPFHSSINGATINLKSSIGITAYYHNGTSRDELVAEASRALELAEVEENGSTFLMAHVTPPDDNVAE
jgi:diguanylate cyclase (GGDEF)-like protein